MPTAADGTMEGQDVPLLVDQKIQIENEENNSKLVHRDTNLSPREGASDVSKSNHSPDGVTVVIPGKVSVIERETNSRLTLMVISFLSVILDLSRQLCSYEVKYSNHDVYPVPTTFMVFISEGCKLLIFITKMLISGELMNVSISFSYLIPSLLYALNNNIYFVALMFTTPPVWNILMQTRVVSTAMVYRFYFKKPVTGTQWTGLVVLTLAIAILQFSDHGTPGSSDQSVISWNLVVALSLAVFASICSTIGPVYAEYLLKNDDRSFDDKQLQMYLFGSILSLCMFAVQIHLPGAPSGLLEIKGNEGRVRFFITACIAFTTLCGLVVAVIMKKLDNIVKLYTQAVSSGLTCIACFVLFPRMFQFDILFIVSLFMTFVAIYLYEVKDSDCRRHCCGKTR